MATKEDILEATISIFNDKGMKFTMDDLARSLSISKKTIYVMFPDKKTLLLETIDYLFDQIKEKERKIYEAEGLSSLEKFEQIMIAMPDRFWSFDFGKIRALRFDSPEIYEQISKRLDSGWELTIELYERCVAEGLVRRIDIPILKALLEGAINQMLEAENLTGEIYRKGLNEMLDVIMQGLLVRE